MGLDYLICENCFTEIYPMKQKNMQFFSCPGCGTEKTVGEENFFGERETNLIKLPNQCL